MPTLRLLYAIQGEVLGGAELHAIDLARRLALRGHHVTATCRPGAGAIRSALVAAAGPFRELRFVETHLELAALIDELRPQLVQHFNGWVAPAALQLARHRPLSVQLVHANHALDPSHPPSPTQATDLLVAVSDSAARHFPTREGGPPLRVIRNGIDTSHFTPAVHAAPCPPIRLLSVGRFDEAAKRAAALVTVCAGLPDRAWTLTLLGDGPDRAAVERIVRDRGLRNVDVLGHREDPAPHYRSAHMYLSYSPSEAFGRSLAEAAAAGLAILARHCHGVSDLLEDGLYARIARSDAEFAQALRELVSDAALRGRLGRAARGFAVKNLDVQRMVDAYEDLYRELIAEPRPARPDDGFRSRTELESW